MQLLAQFHALSGQRSEMVSALRKSVSESRWGWQLMVGSWVGLICEGRFWLSNRRLRNTSKSES